MDWFFLSFPPSFPCLPTFFSFLLPFIFSSHSSSLNKHLFRTLVTLCGRISSIWTLFPGLRSSGSEHQDGPVSELHAGIVRWLLLWGQFVGASFWCSPDADSWWVLSVPPVLVCAAPGLFASGESGLSGSPISPVRGSALSGTHVLPHDFPGHRPDGELPAPWVK